jgi:DNA-binding NarL/FixJ family response regulator
MEDDKNHFLTAVRHGVLDYVLQEASAVDIATAIRAVARGEAICPPHLVRVLFDSVKSKSAELPNSPTRVQPGLSRREQQLVPLIGRGLTNKEIAGQLSLSEQTVKNHIHRMLRKVGVEDRLSVVEACQAKVPNSQSRTGYSA